jgi:phosphotriesterase-related protein
MRKAASPSCADFAPKMDSMTNRRGFLAGAAMAAMCPVAGVAAARGMAQTVLGPLDVSSLGFTLSHEHIADAPDVLARWKGSRAQFVVRAMKELKRVRASGVGTVADLTTYDVGRDIRFLEEVSRKSGLQVIAATGQRFFPPQGPHVTMPARTIEGLAAFFTREITQGIDGTAIKAGVIKIGIIGANPTALEETGLRAAARASKATGAPIRTHTAAAKRGGESHAAILEDEGVNPARVSFDHSDDSGDMAYFLGLARRGYSLGMDHVHRGIGGTFKPPFEQRARCIFLSQDTEFGGALLPEESRNWREKIDPAEGMLFTSRKLIPYLASIGVSARDIHAMTVENPRSFFSLS